MSEERREPADHDPELAPSQHPAFTESGGDLSLRIGRFQIDIDSRWEAASILNDIMTGLWFLAGTIMNLVGGFGDWPLYMYLAGSLQLLLRAALRLAMRVHVGGGYRRSRPRMYRPDIDP